MLILMLKLASHQALCRKQRDENQQLRPKDEELVFVEWGEQGLSIQIDQDRRMVGGRIVLRTLALVAVDDGEGGGIYAANSELTVQFCYFIENTAGGGGGITFENSGGSEVDATGFWNNNADRGGGIYLGSSDVTFNQCLVEGNTAAIEGGGLLDANAQGWYEELDAQPSRDAQARPMMLDLLWVRGLTIRDMRIRRPGARRRGTPLGARRGRPIPSQATGPCTRRSRTTCASRTTPS